MSKVSIETSSYSFAFPLISDSDFANQKLIDFVALYNDSYPDNIKNILAKEENKNLLLSIFSNSPHLTNLLFKYSEFSLSLFSRPLNNLFETTLTNLKNEVSNIHSINELMRLLRIAKAHISLIIAFADLSGKWPLTEITKSLSDFAELALNLSVNFLLKEGIDSGNHNTMRK